MPTSHGATPPPPGPRPRRIPGSTPGLQRHPHRAYEVRRPLLRPHHAQLQPKPIPPDRKRSPISTLEPTPSTLAAALGELPINQVYMWVTEQVNNLNVHCSCHDRLIHWPRLGISPGGTLVPSLALNGTTESGVALHSNAASASANGSQGFPPSRKLKLNYYAKVA